MGEIGKLQSPTADITDVLQAAQAIHEDYQRELVLTALAVALSDAGDFSGAIRTANSIDSEFARSNTWTVIAAAQALTGDVSGAMATARHFNANSERPAGEVMSVLDWTRFYRTKIIIGIAKRIASVK